ncbi:MAG: HAD-IIIA family hydrolase [Desulfuromonadales bacterium]|nr:HAD-IIIA family hydrolase [Desulfuromonadales bacterium]
MTVALVLFDLDGTLVDSLHDLTDAVNHMLKGFDRQQLTPEQVRQLVGKGAGNLVQRALATDSCEDIGRGLAMFTEYNAIHIVDKSRLYPGARELLQQLAAAGIRMAVITNKNEALSRLILKALDINSFFETIAGGDSYSEMKPSPLPLLRVIGEQGINPAESVMVGDSINDIQAGRRAGITTIGCGWGYGEQQEIADADFSAASCDELAGILRGLCL